MYNRYIPQSDGSFQRRRIPEPISHAMPAPCPSEMPAAPPTCPPPKPSRPSPPPHPRPRPRQPERNESIGGFLQQLLPRDFDTGDLLVVLLLLLMSADSREDPNTALLTLALYLFL